MPPKKRQLRSLDENPDDFGLFGQGDARLFLGTSKVPEDYEKMIS